MRNRPPLVAKREKNPNLDELILLYINKCALFSLSLCFFLFNLIFIAWAAALNSSAEQTCHSHSRLVSLKAISQLILLPLCLFVRLLFSPPKDANSELMVFISSSPTSNPEKAFADSFRLIRIFKFGLVSPHLVCHSNSKWLALTQ